MANVKFKMSLPVYAHVAQKLAGTTDGVTCRRCVYAEFVKDAYIVNEDEIEPENATVQVTVSSDCIGLILGYCLDVVSPDGKYAAGNENVESILGNEYASRLIGVHNERLAEKAAERDRQAAYEAWLTDCFDKYVVDASTPSCKEIAVAINNGESSSEYTPIKYQNIMRYLKAYRAEKFSGK